MESIDILINAASILASTITDKLHPHVPEVTRAAVVELEENERNLRMMHPAQEKIQKDNAARVITLLTQAPLNLQPSKGIKRITRSLEEAERTRRINTKAEYALRRIHANKIAGIIRGLGWPFYQYDLHEGASYILVDPTSLLEEEERAYRLSNPHFVMTAKNNAALISSLVRWSFPVRLSVSGRFTRSQEERERRRRTTSPDEETAIYNATLLSNQIRSLGWPFYQQEADRAEMWESVHVLEEKERHRRIADVPEQQRSREHAGEISGLLLSQKNNERRAHREAAILEHALIEPSISGAHVRRMAGLASPVPSRAAAGELQIGKQSILALMERERERRIHDPISQYNAIGLAKQLSGLVSAAFSNAVSIIEARPTSLPPIEQERQRRMYDRPAQLLAMRNARKVSGLVSKAFLPNLSSQRADMAAAEERERERRIQEQEEQRLAMENAKRVSSLIGRRGLHRRAISESGLQQISDISTFVPMIATSRLPSSNNMSLPASPMPFSPWESHHVIEQSPAMTSLSIAPSPLYRPCPEAYAAPQLPAPVIKKLAASVVQTAADPTVQRAPPGFEALPAYAVPRPAATRYLPLQHSSSAPNLVGISPAASPATQQRVPLTKAMFSATPVVGAPIPVLPSPAFVPCVSAQQQQQPALRSALRSSTGATPPLAVRFNLPQESVPMSSIPSSTLPSSSRALTSSRSLSSLSTSNYSFPAHTYQAPAAYNAMGIAPFASPAQYQVVPPIAAPIAGQINDKEQKRIEKTAQRHAKLADKAQKKATKELAKAEKLHTQGKDSRAVRYQNKAEQQLAVAQQHSDYAANYQKDMTKPVSASPQQPGILTAGQSSM